jgi:glycosyl transferase family 25
MKVLVINLEKDRDRWASVEAQLRSAGLDYERVPAIFGRDLGPQERAIHYSPLRSSWRQALGLTSAEIGCALSHLKAYREISTRGFSHTLILEDDVVFEDGLAGLLEAIAPHMPAHEPVVCLLSPAEGDASDTQVPLAAGRVLQSYKAGYYTSSYCLTRAAAERLLADLHPVGDVADCWARLGREGRLKLVAVLPSPVTQNQADFGSSTTEDIRAALGVSFFSKLVYRLRRVRNILLSRLVERCWRHRADPVVPLAYHPIDSLAAK